MKILTEGAELFHTDAQMDGWRQTDSNKEANSSF
jgi:hypothetical protein